MNSSCKHPGVRPFRHEATGTWSYVVSDPDTLDAVVIDPVMDFEYRAGRLYSCSADLLVDHVRAHGLKVRAILETHAHADHVSAAPYLLGHWAVPLMIGAGIVAVQSRFCGMFNLHGQLAVDGSQFDRLLHDQDALHFGSLQGRVIATPGHTSDSCSYQFADAVFVGDTLFAPDYGTARCDFPGGDAGLLYDSIQKLYQLPHSTRVFLCHDYPPADRAPMAETSIGAELAQNIHINADTTREAFVSMRRQRDAGLAVPELLIPAVQLNINAGAALPAEDNGVRYLKVPLNQL
ncbi:MAG: MBL fold metallo-hydrolase [Gammaproteobacteria bacterium]|nr:MBL fold metallo-hydrolase [Gammaproteobacteria bacterium]